MYRGAPVTVPRDVAGVEFRVDASTLTGRVVVELRDASDNVVRKETFRAGRIDFRVPMAALDERTYQLTVRPAGTPVDAPVPIEEVFALELGGDS